MLVADHHLQPSEAEPFPPNPAMGPRPYYHCDPESELGQGALNGDASSKVPWVVSVPWGPHPCSLLSHPSTGGV